MLKGLKNFQTLNLAKPSKKAWLSPEANTHIDANEIFDTIVKTIADNEEDINPELYDQLTANRDICIKIMIESLDAELVYDYINCELGKGIIAGIVLTLMGQHLMQLEISALEDKEDEELSGG